MRTALIIVLQNNLSYWRKQRYTEAVSFWVDYDKLSFYQSMVDKYQQKVDKLIKK